METLNERIKQLRKEKGLTQSQLADELGVTDKAVSKWEVGEANPDISLLVKLAEVFNVTVDYLLTGKVEESLSLDDMDKDKRAVLLAKKDDAVNFEKFKHVDSRILFSQKMLRDLHCTNLDIRKAADIRNAIIESQSKKVFSLLADKLLEELRRGEYINSLQYYTSSMACLVYDCLDDFVKLCALSGKIELLEFIKFKSFGVSNKENEMYYKATRIEEFYHVKQETIDFIFTDKRVPTEVVNYVAKYEKYSKEHCISYTFYGVREMDSSTAIRMRGNVITALYNSGRFELLETYLNDIYEEVKEKVEAINSSEIDMCWRSSYNVGSYGYLFYTNGNGSTETTTCSGRIGGVEPAISCAIEHKDKARALKYAKINAKIKELIDSMKAYKNKPSISVPTEEMIDGQIERMERDEKLEFIKTDTTISEKERRRKLFEMNALSVGETVEADDYELFIMFPVEMTSKVSISALARTCNDIRFYIFAANFDQPQERLNDALAEILQRLPERYDIIDVLLSAGAQVVDNPSMTAILKQNIQILNNQKANKAADVKIDAEETKDALLKDLDEGKIEHVIVNLAFQAEQKLKAKYGNLPLLNMINMANKDGWITDIECTQLHNLRKSRNTIMHEGDERGHYTADVVKEWMKVVFKL